MARLFLRIVVVMTMLAMAHTVCAGNAAKKRIAGIHDVDFKNFSYPSAELRKTIKVRKGEYKKAGDVTVSVVGISYADINGDGEDDAVVYASTYYQGANYSIAEFYIFRAEAGKPVLMDHMTDKQINRDYQTYHPNGALWSLDSFAVDKGTITYKFAADGPHCCPEYYAHMKYGFNGKKMVLSGRPVKTKFE
jgi:hypothetical protein